jgi:hypothetical protein
MTELRNFDLNLLLAFKLLVEERSVSRAAEKLFISRLSRLQFAFTISFHIIFPAFTIGLAAWLTILEALHLKTGRPVYRVLFEFWLKIFGLAFGLGGRIGSCDGIPVRHELERAVEDVRTDSGAPTLI